MSSGLPFTTLGVAHAHRLQKPYGYTSSQSGLFGAVLLISGIIAALCTAPLLDRVLTHHIALAIRILCPIIGLAWLSLIWAGVYRCLINYVSLSLNVV